MKKKLRWLTVGILLILWLSFGLVDFYRVSRFETPIFCFLIDGEDDGGSGRYQGLGYSFEIEGNFMPEDEFPGVTHYRANLFGMEISAGIRD